jgi:four helix bundle protein
VRNSSLVEGLRADNVSGLKPATEAVGCKGQGARLKSQGASSESEGEVSRGTRAVEKSKGYEELEVYRRSYGLALEVHRLTLSFPSFEERELARQLRSATKSIAVNIAEGYGRRPGTADARRFLIMAQGSCDEVRVWLTFAGDLGYISQAEKSKYLGSYEEIGKMLGGLLRAWGRK